MENLNNKNQAKFIKTQDLKTYEELMGSGFKLVNYVDGTWTFINNSDCSLSFDNKKITYSNILCI